MDFNYAVKSRRSVRAFKDRGIPFDVLQDILEAAIWAPAAGNIYNTRIIVVEDDAMKREIASACLDQNFVAEAPVVLIMCSVPDKVEAVYKERGKLYQIQGTAAATQNILLAATDKGISSCWVGAFSDNQVRRALEIPENVQVHAIIPLGYRNEVPVPPRKLNLADILHWHKWFGRDRRPAKQLKEHAKDIKRKLLKRVRRK